MTIVSIFILILMDQLSKILVTKFYLNSSFIIIPKTLSFLPKQNTHGSYLFNLMDYKASIALQITILILVFIVIIVLYKYLFHIMNSKIIKISLIFILAGSIGAAFDTIFGVEVGIFSTYIIGLYSILKIYILVLGQYF
nr:signal peptidase II [Miniphocaeibacter halophilus]